MIYKRILFSIIAAIFFSCEGPDASFLDYYEVSTSLTQESVELFWGGKAQNFEVKINEDNRIYGVGLAKRFYTDDFFETITYTRGFSFGNYHEIDGKFVQRTEFNDDLNQIIIEESVDWGISYSVKTIIEDIHDDDFVYYPQDENVGWILSKRNIIKIDGSAYTPIQTIDGYRPLSIWFDGPTGYILIAGDFRGDIKHIYKSNDYGTTWHLNSTIELIEDSYSTPYNINYVKGYGELIYAYFDAGTGTSNARPSDYMYVSRDGGANWHFYKENDLLVFQFLDEKNGYAIKATDYAYSWEDEKVASKGILHSTTDGGITWSPVTENEIYADRIFFLNAEVGLAMSYSCLQVTFDGGLNWKLLVFPLEERLND